MLLPIAQCSWATTIYSPATHGNTKHTCYWEECDSDDANVSAVNQWNNGLTTAACPNRIVRCAYSNDSSYGRLFHGKVFTCPGDCASGYTKGTGVVGNVTGCNTSNQYSYIKCTANACGAGYYGSANNCTKCPSPGTSATGTTSVTGCYATSGSDGTGTYKFTSNCYYSN